MGLTEPFPVSPQVMETRQVSRSSRVRLLLLLLLLVPWGVGTASGVALPPTRVFRYVQCPRLPGRGGQRGGKRPKKMGEERLKERDRDPEKGGQRLGSGRDGGGWGISKKKKQKEILRKASRDSKGVNAETDLSFEKQSLDSGGVPGHALGAGQCARLDLRTQGLRT